MSFPFLQSYLGLGSGLQTKNASGSWELEDNFDNAGIYTQTGTKVTVDSGVSDALYFNAVADGTDQRVSRSLGFTMSDTAWYARWTVNFTTITIPGHHYIQFISNVGDVWSTVKDLIGINMGNDNSSCCTIYADSTTGFTGSADNIVVTTSTQYYEELIRQSATSVRHAIYSNSGYSSNISGSPDTDTIASTIQSLAHFQSSNCSACSPSRVLTATIDTLKINNGATTAP